MKKRKMGRRAVAYLCIIALLITAFPAGKISHASEAQNESQKTKMTLDIKNHWAQTQIDNLLEKGYIKGYPDGSFKPDKNITRAEFMAVVNSSFNFEEKADSGFKDIKTDAWYADTILRAKSAGYISGYQDNTIRPNNPITRQEVAAIISKIKKISADEGEVFGFKDSSSISAWSKEYIGAIAEAEIMKGYPDGSFKAEKNLTRAEAAVIVSKALAMETYTQSGTYGPSTGTKTLSGNVGIYADGVKLQNTIIEGNLLVAESVLEGTVTLDNVVVKGNTTIKGGGEHSIIVINSKLGNVNITKENGKIRILASGETEIGKVTAASGVKLEESGLSSNAAGFKEVIVSGEEKDTIILVGNFDTVNVNVSGITVNIPSGSIIASMILEKKAVVTGTGTIKAAQTFENGTSFEKQPVSIKTATDATSLANTTKPSSGSKGNDVALNNNYADMVLKNGVIYSVNDKTTNAAITNVQAVAIKNGKFIYTGTDAGLSSYIGASTQVIDLEGKMAVPGFSDAHAHGKAMAANMKDISLYSAPTTSAAIAMIQDWYDTKNPSYITGNGWNTFWADELNKSDLDAISTDIPIVIYDASHHMAWANSKAISMAGITIATPNPPGGVIVKEGGEIKGIFHEDSAIGLLVKEEIIPDNTVEDYKAGILEYQAMANSFGITLNQDPQLTENAITAYKELAEAGLLTLRVRGGYLSSPVLTDDGANFATASDAALKLEEFAANSSVKHTVGDLFKMNFVKIYADGGGPTTYMKGGPDYKVWPQDQLNYLCDLLEKNGVQIHCHSMGNASLASLLDSFQYSKDQGNTSLRNSITHLQYVDDGSVFSDDASRMAELGVIGLPQPYWMVRDSYYTMYFPFCGEELTSNCYPMQSLIDKGVIMAGSSDWPVTQPNAPLNSIQSGVTRTLAYDDPYLAYAPDMVRNPMYRYPLGPTGNLTKDCADVKTMLQSVTYNGAYATFLEEITGSIQVGKSADMVVLDKNLLSVEGKDIGKTNVMMTIFKGQIVYASSQPTARDFEIVKYKSAPSYPGDPTPYGLVIKANTKAETLLEALNEPVNGSLKIVDNLGVEVDAQAELLTGMILRSSAPNPANVGAEIVTEYPITLDLPDLSNSFTVSNITDTGFTVTLANPIVGLTKDDIYVLRDYNKVSAITLDVTDVNGDGAVYTVLASDVDSTGNLTNKINGEHNIYVYSPYVPPYVPNEDTVFTNQGELIVCP